MALTLPALQSLRDALVKARLGGVRAVKDQNGEELTYKSDSEMKAAIADVESRIASMQSGTAPNVIRFNASKFGD